jgi:predicted MFS family arabinose efflux permease
MTRVVRHSSAEGLLTTPLVLLLTLAAAIGTSATYPLLPAVSDVARTLGASVSATGLALGSGPFGYFCGLGFVVPLVDRLNPRYLLGVLFAVLAAALATTSFVGSTWQLALIGVLVGAMSAVGAALSSLVGRLALPGRRASRLGVLTAGISGGIIAGRLAGGWLTDLLGWRQMLLVYALTCVAIAIALSAWVPAARAPSTDSYWWTLARLPGRFRLRPLRLAAARGACWFLAFCALWAGIAVALSRPPFAYSAEQIGWYAAAGLSGLPATHVAGRLTDRIGARAVLVGGLALASAALLALAFLLPNPPAVVVCLAMFDAGTFAAQVANQSTVLAIDPAAPAGYNSAYMMVFFVGGSLGTALAAPAVEWLGWTATALVLVMAVAAALALSLVPNATDDRSTNHQQRAVLPDV